MNFLFLLSHCHHINMIHYDSIILYCIRYLNSMKWNRGHFQDHSIFAKSYSAHFTFHLLSIESSTNYLVLNCKNFDHLKLFHFWKFLRFLTTSHFFLIALLILISHAILKSFISFRSLHCFMICYKLIFRFLIIHLNIDHLLSQSSLII
jgi:hypothetical protein